jgi:DNA repair ATPase RecN
LGEEEELQNELILLENAERLTELNTNIFNQLYDSENSVFDNINIVKGFLYELSKIDGRYNEKINESESILAMVQETVIP